MKAILYFYTLYNYKLKNIIFTLLLTALKHFIILQAHRFPSFTVKWQNESDLESIGIYILQPKNLTFFFLNLSRVSLRGVFTKKDPFKNFMDFIHKPK